MKKVILLSAFAAFTAQAQEPTPEPVVAPDVAKIVDQIRAYKATLKRPVWHKDSEGYWRDSLGNYANGSPWKPQDLAGNSPPPQPFPPPFRPVIQIGPFIPGYEQARQDLSDAKTALDNALKNSNDLEAIKKARAAYQAADAIMARLDAECSEVLRILNAEPASEPTLEATPNPDEKEAGAPSPTPYTTATPSPSEPSPTPGATVIPLLSDERSTAAFNFLQDQFHRPHAKAVWYDSATDSYVWIGPKKGKRMSMPRKDFEDQISIPYIKSQNQ